MMQQALPLEALGLDVDEVRARAARGEPPASAEEYLLRVRLEFDALPEVMEAQGVDLSRFQGRQTRYMPAQPDLPPTPPGLAADAAWEAEVLRDFVDVRLGLAALEEELGVGRERRVKVPPLKEEGLWRRFFFGRKQRPPQSQSQPAQSAAGAPEEEEEEGEEDEHEEQGEEEHEAEAEAAAVALDSPATTVDGAGSSPLPPAAVAAAAAVAPSSVTAPPAPTYEGPTQPRTSLVLQFDQVCTVRLLGYHAQWLHAAPALSHDQAAWLFALLARLSLPLHPEAAALVRQLFRRCWVLRAGLPATATANGGDSSGGSSGERGDAAAGATGEDKEGEEQEQQQREREGLARLNTLLAITGTFFRQAEGEAEAEEPPPAAHEAPPSSPSDDAAAAAAEENAGGEVMEEEEEEGEIREEDDG